MITIMHAWLMRVRRKFSRSEWAVRLLGLAPSSEAVDATGLIICQIDGLARRQFEVALNQGRLPFLRSLLENENYRMRTHYSGLPSTTAAVQGELFFGKKTAVPAFSFVSTSLQQGMIMIQSAAVAAVESRLVRHAPGLLEDGAVYASVYSGGARESHFSPTSLGWDGGFRHSGALAVLPLVLLHLYSLLRIGVLLLVEFVLAGIDFGRGLMAGKSLAKELKFVPTRVGVTVVLRELLVAAVKIDAARGVPIIYANFLGYDEQSHRRGPSSAFAHWTLKGIDDAMLRIWTGAQRSGRRRYEFWILSDHGQQSVRTHQSLTGIRTEVLIRDVLRRHNVAPLQLPDDDLSQEHVIAKAGLFGRRLLQRLWPGGASDMAAAWRAMGPVAHLYVAEPLAEPQRQAIADDLIIYGEIPLVLWRGPGHKVMARTRTATFVLPADIHRLAAENHVCIEQLGRDLVGLVHHPDAGAFVALGWVQGQMPVSFAFENGAHGGIGPDETQGFILTPGYAPLPDRAWVRPREVRQAALQELSSAAIQARRRPCWSRKQQRRDFLRVMTYNVHRCVGMDGKLSVDRIAQVIAAWNPDVVALQELDVGRPRTGHVDQAHSIAKELEMDFHFHPALTVAGEQYGDAILCRYAMRPVHAGALPGWEARPGLEPRGAIWCKVAFNDHEIDVFTTHLGLRRAERRAQIEALLGDEWLDHPDCKGPVVFCGDLNAWPLSDVCGRLRQRHVDVQEAEGANQPLATWFGHFPLWRIDYIFLSAQWTVNHVDVPRTRLTRIASDHLPIIADLRLRW